MALVIFYIFVLLAIGSALVVVWSRNVVHSAFALMVTLFCLAAFYVYLDADFLAAIQITVYVGGILVLVLFGVMMTSGTLLMKLRAPVGQLIPALAVGLLLLGVLLHVAVRDAPWKQFLLVNDEAGRATAQIQKEKDSNPALADVRLAIVRPHVILRFIDVRDGGPSGSRQLAHVVEDVLYAKKDRPGFSRVYVVRSRQVAGTDDRVEIVVERRVTSLVDQLDSATISDGTLGVLTSAVRERVPAGFEVESITRPRMAYVHGLDGTSRDIIIDKLGIRPAESRRSIVGMGDAVIMGEFLLPFEIVGVLLLVALIGAAVVSRKGVAV